MINEVKKRVVVRRLNGIDEIRTIYTFEFAVSMRPEWPDGMRAVFWKISKGGFRYYKEV